MRKLKLYTLGVSVMILAGMTACQDDFDNPPLRVPEATLTPNTTILDVKTKYWDDATNYIDTIKLTESGEHVVIAGRVISSDATGNIYKNLVIQDESAAIAMSINANSLYNDYRLGQEIIIDLTDMYIGKYNGLQQLGFPEYSDMYGWEATFMPPEFFYAHSQLNGLPEPEKMDTITVKLSELPSNPEGLRKWQSQLVRINNVSFTGGGSLPFSEEDASTNRTLTDSHGNSIIVRNSNYASFYNQTLPAGNGDVVGILSYYGTSGWQILLRFASDCMNFGNPTMEQGTEDNPYTVEQAKELIGSETFGWMTGYIVGAVGEEVVNITSNEDIEWKAPTTLAGTLVIGATPETKDIADCFVIALPQDSKLREVGNLRDNPDVYQRQIWVSGTFGTYMDANGVLNNAGSTSEFRIDGVDTGDKPTANGDGTEAAPYSVTQVLNGSASGTAWVSGYIVGWIDGKSIFDGAKFDAAATIETNVLIAATPNETNVDNCIPVQLPSGSVRSGVNLKSHPENFGKLLTINASIEKYFGVNGLKSATDYKLDGEGADTPDVPTDGGTKDAPYTIAQVLSGSLSGTGWAEGYIVGWVDGMTLSEGAKFNAESTIRTNILVADKAGETNLSNCVPVQLPSGSVRDALNLSDNPGNFGKKVKLNGSFEKYFGASGIKSVTEYELEGASSGGDGGEATVVTSLNEDFEAGFSNWKNVIVTGTKSWVRKSFSENYYMSCSGYGGDGAAEAWLISSPIDIANCANKVLTFENQVCSYDSTGSILEVYVLTSDDPTKATKTKLDATYAVAPGGDAWSSWVSSGNLDLSRFSGTIYIGFRYYTPNADSATWAIDNVKL